MGNTTAIILAAGKGTRMRSSHAKVVHRVAQRPMISWVNAVCREAGADKTIAIVGHKKEEVQEVLGMDAMYVEQTELLGTGHAVMQAAPLLEDDDTIIILSGDVPLVQAKTIKEALAFHQENEYAVTVLAAVLDNPFGYGRIVRDGKGDLRGITEERDADDEIRQIREVNSGMYCFDAKALKEALSELRPNNAQGEYYLTDTISILRTKGQKAGVFCMENPEEQNGVNDMLQLYEADKIMRRRICQKHMAEGVYIWDIENTYIAPDVVIGQGTEIRPGCILNGSTVIEEDTVIGPNTTIENCRIGRGTTVANSVLKDSVVGEKTNVGPFAYVRPGSKIGNGCKVGDFVEIKNATLGDGTKASHLTYVGDSVVGQRVNFGCGTVTVNYDGSAKYKTLIGNDAFIGCNTNLVAPVSVGDGAYIAAGSTITDEVPGETLAIARARQVIKDNWTDKRKKK